jgi:hypothetical protein
MATNRDLLKEAIADAKAVKEMAIANAKAALEEAFTPQLKTMLSAKLQEMELEEEKEVEEAEIDEVGFEDNMTLNTGVKEEKDDDMMEVDLEELLAELEEEEKMEEAELNESEITEEEMEDESRAERADVDKFEYEKGKEAGEEEGEALDLEDMTDEDLKKFIEDVITDMVESGELEAGEGAEEEEGEDVDVDVDVDVEDEEEVDLAELLKEIEDMEEGMKYYEDDMDEAKDSMEDLDALYADKLEEGEAIEEGFLKKLFQGREEKFLDKYYPEWKNSVKNEKDPKKKAEAARKIVDDYRKRALKGGQTLSSLRADTSELYRLMGVGSGITKGTSAVSIAREGKEESELKEAYDTIKTLKEELDEINLLNAKLLYTNKIFRSKNLTESQKVKVLGSFDNATTVKETKLVFKTLNEGIKVKKPSVEKTIGSASKATNTPTTKKPIVESNEAYLRMQKLAGLIK